MMFDETSINVPVSSVLAADDNYDNLFLLSYIMETLNCQCYGVIDSTKILDLAVDKTPDLILLNIMMPDLSGFGVISQLKSN